MILSLTSAVKSAARVDVADQHTPKVNCELVAFTRQGDDSYTDPGCAYNYGWNAALQAFGTAFSAISEASRASWWWLDVEIANSWNGDETSNAADVQGSIDYLISQHVAGVGVYSTAYEWALITGGYVPTVASGPPVANWVAGARSLAEAPSFCDPAYSLWLDGSVQLVQYPADSFDGDYIC